MADRLKESQLAAGRGAFTSRRTLPTAQIEMDATSVLAATSSSPWAAVAGVAVGSVATLSVALLTTRANKARIREQERQREFDRVERDADRAQRELDLTHQLERARSDRRDEWHTELREKMLEGAAELSAVLGSALLTAEFLRIDDVHRTAAAVEEDLRPAPALISRVRLLFGPHSPPASAAVVAHMAIEHMLTVIKELASLEGVVASDETEPASRERARQRYENAEQRFDSTRETARDRIREFNEATNKTLWELGGGAQDT